MTNLRIDYKAMMESGEIKSLYDLIPVWRAQLIGIYGSVSRWPDYDPTEKDHRDLGNIYSLMEIEEEIPFSAFVQIMTDGLD